MIMSAYSFLNEVRSPSEEEILHGMNDNFCRCGSHVRIVKAILAASKEMKGGRR
jgi:aerobic-type carbon monoxide dehydrogenase small subunit (CoxS/CutS family)